MINRENMEHEKEIVLPPYLKEGDKVALVSPAYWIPQESIQEAAETVKSWGLQPVIGPHTNSLNVNVYAGTADERAADILWALKDDSIKAIICTRGGYGSIHLLNRIHTEDYQKHPKWLIGHGDITTLINAVTSAGVMSIHGPMAFQLANGQELDSQITRDVLFGTIPQYKIAGNDHNRCGHAEGVLVGCSWEVICPVLPRSSARSFCCRLIGIVSYLSKKWRSRCTISTDCSICFNCKVALNA